MIGMTNKSFDEFRNREIDARSGSDMMVPIRLITFDALYTIIYPRRPIHVQYAEVFEPYLGPLNPRSIQQSFKTGKVSSVRVSH